MLVIFDVDGTLIDDQTHDWPCFDAAFKHVCGFLPSDAFWKALDEWTAKAIIHAALAELPIGERNRLEVLVQDEYLVRLVEAHRLGQEAFKPMVGAAELLCALRKTPGVSLAIATGDWHSSISFKLQAAGLDVAGIPMATCSDLLCRAEIIALAASRAGCGLEEAVYVGDGLWDLRACAALGIPCIGIGSRSEALKKAGAIHVLPDLSPGPFQSVLCGIRGPQIRT